MDACREIGVTEQTYYRWRKQYGGMSREQLKRLKELESENRRLKQMLADTMLENRAMQDVLAKKW